MVNQYKESGFMTGESYMALIVLLAIEGLAALVLYFTGQAMGGVLTGFLVADLIGAIYVFMPGIQSYGVLAGLFLVGFIMGGILNGYFPIGNAYINFLTSGDLIGQVAGFVFVTVAVVMNGIVIYYTKIPDAE